MKAGSTIAVVIDQHAGQARFVDGKETSNHLAGIDLFPRVERAVAWARKAGHRVVSALLPSADPSRDRGCGSAEIEPAAAWDGAMVLPDDLSDARAFGKAEIVVAADRRVRARASAAGLRALPHAALLEPALRGEELCFAEAVCKAMPHRLDGFVPYDIDREPSAVRLLGVWTVAAATAAARQGASVSMLPFDLATEDLVRVRVDAWDERALSQIRRRRVMRLDAGSALVALGGDASLADFDLHGAHGHFEHLAPRPELSDPPPRSESSVMVEAWGQRLDIKDLIARRIDPRIFELPWPACPATASQIQGHVNRYTGVTDPGGGPIRSRHIAHPDNARAVSLLISDLRSMGYCARRHEFTYEGRVHANVIADWPGIGCVELSPDIRSRLRELLIQSAEEHLTPGDFWNERANDLPAHIAARAVKDVRLLERIYRLPPWYPWWHRCPLAGAGAELVIVGCHLDSTASRDAGYDPATGAAPGVDDDASGIAATLAIAKHVSQRRLRLRHTLRFCFFNAEEQGRIGSKAYAAYLKSFGAPVRGAFLMDMVGYDMDALRAFEIHAGATDAAVRDASVPLADSVAAWANSAGRLTSPQIYRGTSSASGTDRSLYDGAIGRSDHSSFHEQGYPAVVVSEDFFANAPGEPAAEPNPSYHRASDSTIDPSFIADIACAVMSAAVERAQ